MNQITVDESWAAQLRGLSEETEFRDSDGKLWGCFKPRAVLDAEYVEALKARTDPAELERRKREGQGTGCSLDQVIAALRSTEQKAS